MSQSPASSRTRVQGEYENTGLAGFNKPYNIYFDEKREIKAVSFWSPELKEERKSYFKNVALGLTLTSIVMWLTLSIYWGSYHEQPQQLHRLTIGLLDLDSPACAAATPPQTATVGPAMLNSAVTTTEQYHLGWREIDNTQFDISEGVGGPRRGVDAFEWSRQAVHNQDYFGIIIANSNATLLASSSLTTLLSGATPSQMYMGTGAVTLVYNEARNFDTYDQWIAPGMTRFVNQFLPQAATTFAQGQLAAVSGSIGGTGVNRTAVAGVLAAPFGSSTWNIAPLDAFAGIPATTVGLIYILIFTYFVSLFWSNIRQPIEGKLKTPTFLLMAIGVPVAQYFIISLSISLISLAFHVPFDRFYTRGGFVIFWIMNFLTQWAVGMIMELSLAILGPRFTAFFLIFWVILNVSGVFLALSNMNHFYAYSFGLPVYNAVDTIKSLAFGTKNHLAQNFAVNLTWCALGTIGLASVHVAKRAREAKKQQ